MYTHRSTNTAVVFWDTANQLNGYMNEAGDFYPLTVQMLNTEKMKPNTGSEVAMSPVRITLADNLEFDRDGALLAMTGLSTLIPLTEVVITVISASATSIVVEVNILCDGVALEGFWLSASCSFILLLHSGLALWFIGNQEVTLELFSKVTK